MKSIGVIIKTGRVKGRQWSTEQPKMNYGKATSNKYVFNFFTKGGCSFRIFYVNKGLIQYW